MLYKTRYFAGSVKLAFLRMYFWRRKTDEENWVGVYLLCSMSYLFMWHAHYATKKIYYIHSLYTKSIDTEPTLFNYYFVLEITLRELIFWFSVVLLLRSNENNVLKFKFQVLTTIFNQVLNNFLRNRFQ